MVVCDLYKVINNDHPVMIIDRRLEKIVFEGIANQIPAEYMPRLIDHVGIGYNRNRSLLLTIEIW